MIAIRSLGLSLAAALMIAAPAADAQTSALGIRRRVTPAGTFVVNEQLVELTGDGLLDLFTVSGGQAVVWRGAPDGSFREVVWSHPAPSGDADSVLVDVDGDLDVDLVIARYGSCTISGCTNAQNELFLNDGAGGFTEALGALPPNDMHGNDRVAAGDVDGDGDVDLVFGGHQECATDPWGILYCLTSACLVWKNDGAGIFTASAGAPAAQDPMTVMLLADLSGDGAAELFGAWNANPYGLGTDEKVFFANDGTGVFTLSTASAGAQPTQQLLQQASAADLDLDGDLDLVATYSGWLSGVLEDARFFRNDGTGALVWDAAELAGFACSVHALLDLDTDGDIDLALGREDAGRRFANDGAGHFADLGAFDAHVQIHGLGGDVDLDGDDDLLFGLRLFLNDGAGALVDATEPLPLPSSIAATSPSRGAALLDLEGDGDLDAAVANAFGPHDLYANDGAGHFSSIDGGAWTTSGDMGVVRAADLDGDGDLDLVAGGDIGTVNAELFHNAAGAFPGKLSLAGADDVIDVVAADVDLDGDLDLAFARGGFYTLPNLLFRNELGTFVLAPSGFPPTPTDSRSLAAIDYDHDGDPDMVEGIDGEDHLWRNDGGAFVDAPGVLPSNLPATRDWGVGDIDLDGDLDLMAGTYAGFPPPNRLYLAVGAGFVDATAGLPSADVSTDVVALADFDLDGDPDALWLGPYDRLLLSNDGTGAFAAAPVPDTPGTGYALAADAGDLDGDLDPDVFVAGGPEHALLFSLFRQLAWRAIPRLGKGLTFELDGSPGALYAQAWSPGTAAFPLVPYGVLRLDPAHVFVLGGGALDGAGHALLTVGLPALPSLYGVTVATQALIGDPPLFSNLETVTITGL